jgi:predicted nucleotidyltransferase
MNLIMKCLFGSHLYQLNTPTSDKDYKGIYLPTKDSLLLGNYRKSYSESTGNDKSKNTKDDTDVDIYSLPTFIEMACSGDTVALDMLHADNLLNENLPAGALYNTSGCAIWDQLKSRRKMFYTKNMKSYIGYARKQANKYGIKGSRMGAVEEVINWLENLFDFPMTDESLKLSKIKAVYNNLPTNEFVKRSSMVDKSNGEKELKFYEICGRKYQDTLTLEQLLNHAQSIYDEYGDRAKQAKNDEGVDWKAVSHALRASYQMLGIIKDGDFEYPLPQTEFLLKVKTGQLNFVNEVQPVLDSLIVEIEELAEKSDLPQNVDRKYWDNWLLFVYEEYL